MAKVLEKVFHSLETLGNDIGHHKHHRTSPRMWADSNGNTMFLP